MDSIEAALAGVWLMIPALVPNSAAVLFGGGPPMDFGRNWRGKRILGDGKTWRGFFGGTLSGVVIGLIMILVTEFVDAGAAWRYGDWPNSIIILFLLGFGSMAGDSVGSFVKRRLSIDRGKKAPVLDQYNFVVGAFVLLLIFSHEWFLDHYWWENGYLGLVLVLVIVPVLHRGVNIIGYKMGKKNVPW